MSMSMSTSPEYVTLISSDAFSYVIKRSIATAASGTLKSMLGEDSRFRESSEGRVTLDTIDGRLLEKICEYMHFSDKWRHTSVSGEHVPEFDFPPEMALELLVAADFLDA
ncbi:elongin C [Saitoella coloradoensis]